MTGLEQYDAPPGKIWQCGACGKYSRNRAGEPGYSWDEACFLNAVLVDAPSVQPVPLIVLTDAER